ncbi:MAG: hypothetical protein KAT28_03290 [Candidatus Aenigmarchaeota archaeon]|nr:hypothetical protein [Candidatus Aenigmarchaeota archaeon]
MKEISETIETYPEGIVLGVVLGVMAYSNPINLDPDILYQSANYLKDVITHINPY